jgi:hypothetical protein
LTAFRLRAEISGIVSVALPARARSRVELSPFVVAGERSDGLAFFGPEVARAVGEALADRGIELETRGAAAITGRVETVGADRVRLSATLHGRTASVEGPFDAIDRLAEDLADRLLPLLDEGASGHPAHLASAHPSRPERSLAAGTPRAHPPSAKSDAPHEAPAPASAHPAPKSEAAAPAHEDSPATAPAPSSSPQVAPPATIAASPTVAASPPAPVVPVVPVVPIVHDPPASLSTAPTVAPTASVDPKPAPPGSTAVDPMPPSVRAPAPSPLERPVTRAPSYYPPRYPYGFRRAFVVAHTIPDIPSAMRGSGGAATQAFYAFLRQRLRLQYVPTGVGLVPLGAAVDEELRVGARAVVMARLISVEYLRGRPGDAAGQSLRCRLEVVVVRDGRPVLRRVILSAPTDPGPIGLRQSREYDPIFMAVYQALDEIAPELGLALASLR